MKNDLVTYKQQLANPLQFLKESWLSINNQTKTRTLIIKQNQQIQNSH